ncbi:MAG TPA: glycosyltransferase family 39 protein, partial [Candidatus Brocadiia bacterium]|nr:glycosyltransferase family 39 protein [Candidatus Brocadiia bacterium]
MSPETPSPHRYPPWLLVAVAASLLVLYGLLWGLPNLWDPAADSLTPQGLLVAQSRDFLRLTSGRYPPLHFYALRLAFVPADALAHLGAFANLKLKSTLYITTARLISAAMFVATVLLVRALTRRLYGPGPGLIAAAVVALCPLAQYYAKNANLDVPYVFWLALALLFLQRFFDEQRSWDLTWAALCATAAVCTKDQAYGFVLLLPVPVLASLRHRLGAWRPVLTSFTVWRAACAAVLGFALCHGLMWNPQPFVEHVRVIAGPASQGWRETTPDLIGQVRLLTETILRLAEAMSEPIFAAAVAGAVLAARQRRGLWLLWGPVGYWLAFLAVAGYVYPRFTLPMVVACAPLAGLALDRLRRWRPAAKPVGAILAGLALAWLAVACAALLYDLDNDTRASAQAWIEEHVPITAKVGFLGPERDMPRLNRAELD